ncbi:MAG TPA: GIY-YIG nuclease family protein [Nitrososphaerales archaeon]|nr:GIY-YIG nuclease family protein [Nitrososphaerales archaeon]
MKGVYVLLLEIPKDYTRRIGSLGVMQFKKGIYAYIGSAQSSLFPRLERHYAKRRKKHLHWHIDYLTSFRIVRMKEAIYARTDSKKSECLLTEKLLALPFSKPVPHFGSTDCKHGCGSHLLLMLDSSQEQIVSSIIENCKELALEPLVYER